MSYKIQVGSKLESSYIVNFVESLPSNPWIILYSLIISALSFFGMLAIYVITKKEKIPFYSIKSTNIFQGLTGQFKPLKIEYNGEEIENLTTTKLFLWNGGKETIDKNDITELEPLKIKVTDNYKMLDINILESSKIANNFKYTLSHDLSELLLTFDYIDKNEGIVIQIIHTGKSEDDIKLIGLIKGAGAPVYKNIPNSKPELKFPLIGHLPLSLRHQQYLTILFLFLMTILVNYDVITKKEQLLPNNVPSFVLLNMIFLLFFILFMKNLSPMGFESFYEDFE